MDGDVEESGDETTDKDMKYSQSSSDEEEEVVGDAEDALNPMMLADNGQDSGEDTHSSDGATDDEDGEEAILNILPQAIIKVFHLCFVDHRLKIQISRTVFQSQGWNDHQVGHTWYLQCCPPPVHHQSPVCFYRPLLPMSCPKNYRNMVALMICLIIMKSTTSRCRQCSNTVKREIIRTLTLPCMIIANPDTISY